MGWLVEFASKLGAQEESLVRDRLVLTLDLLSRIFEGHSATETAQAVVTELAQRLGCERVSLGFGQVFKSGASAIRLFALSHSADFSHRLDLTNQIEQAMAEVVDQGEVIKVYARDERDGQGSERLMVREHRRLQRDFDSLMVCSVPFMADKTCGVFLFEWTTESRNLEEVELLAETLSPIVGKALADYRRLMQPWYRRLKGWFRSEWERLTGPYEGKRKFWAALGLGLFLFFVFAHGTFRVAAPAHLEGEVKRVIAAPFDGFVGASFARAGHVVEQDAVLATLDDRDLRLEGSRWDSQQQQYAKQAQDAQAQHNLAQLQIALAQTRQAQAQRELTQSMLDRSQIRAPFPAVVVSGDLSQQLGAAVKKGQTLYELAPLDSYRIILDVDEVDMPYVEPGQTGSLIVAALPYERFLFEVTLVTPVAEAKEGKNYFRVEARVKTFDPRLRPGMEGVAKISAGSHALLWVWTHRFFDWLRLQSWIWLGI